MKSPHSYQFSIYIRSKSIGKIILVLFASMLSIISLSGLLSSKSHESLLELPVIQKSSTHFPTKTFYQLMSWENHLLKQTNENTKQTNTLKELLTFATNIRFDDPRSFLGKEIPGFSIYDGQILVAGEGTDYTTMPIESIPPAEALHTNKEATLQGTDKVLEPTPPTQSTNGKKSVLLYFTHTRESYLPYLKGESNPDMAHNSKLNVTTVGDHLKAALEKRGIGTETNKTDVVAQLNSNGMAYYEAYQQSRSIIQSAITNEKDLHYFIDIHRDSQRKKVTTASLNGKNYAKIAFIIGAEHPNYEKNLKLATELHNRMETKYKGISRGVFVKQGVGTNGKFNQDLSSNAFLIEVGGVDNTFEEIDQTINAFADIFSTFYWEAEKVNFTVPPQKQ
jgi:stage II sporulation protein P